MLLFAAQPSPSRDGGIKRGVLKVKGLTALGDVSDAAVHYDGYVRVRELLLTQGVPAAARSALDGRAPAGKVQLPLPLHVQSPGTTGPEHPPGREPG